MAQPMARPMARPRTLVCTFATPEFRGSAALLRHTARRAGADEVVVFDERDVQPLFDAHPDLLPDSRGHGWWAWKPWCILRALDLARPGDVVLYCDAAAMFERPLADHAAAVDHVLLFRLAGGHVNEHWTKRDTFEMMGRDTPEARAARQLNAAVQAYRNTPQARAFLEEYLRWCTPRAAVDDACQRPNAPGFRDHRHDQSVLSLLALGHPHVRVARDPTQYGAGDPVEGDEVRGDEVEDLRLPTLLDHHRQRRRPVKVAVITATLGRPHLTACAASVQAQDLPNVEHYVVVDGPQYEAAARAALRPFVRRKPLHVLVLPHNTGAGGHNGHRVYGAMPWLVDADFVAYLDDDNEWDADHLRHLVRAVVDAGAPWGHSLRRIMDADGRDVCPDNCESLGLIRPTVNGAPDRLVDTSCYLVARDLAIRASPPWNRGRVDADRDVTKALLAVPHVCVRRHSLRYRVGATPHSVTADFFLEGNAALGYDFAGYRDLYVFHFSPEATAAMLACRRRRERSYALDEWQMTLLRGLDGVPGAPPADGRERFNLLDGYACADALPPGAAVLVTMCAPQQVPWDLLRERTDLWRVAYTLESPNIRHAAQWNPDLLAPAFDVVLTYAQFLLDDPRVTTLFCPHNCHHLDLADPLDAAQLRRNRGAGRSCAMVLERRDLAGEYVVPGTDLRLECLDPWREALVRDLDDVTVYGAGWDAAAARNPRLKLGHALGHRSLDTRHAVDILQNHAFAVIVENCDVAGYASEKLYDALMAGAVPLYYGNVPPRLGVPEGPDAGVYLDLKKLLRGVPRERASAALRDFLRGLTDAQVVAWRERVAALRAGVLARVDTTSFADAVRAALALRPPGPAALALAKKS